MKFMLNQWVGSLTGAALFAATFPIITQAVQTINVDMMSSGTVYSGTAAAPDTGVKWNSISAAGTLSPVYDSQTNLSGVAIAFASSGTVHIYNDTTTGSPNPSALMSGYTYGATYTLTVTGLAANQPYGLYAYSHGNVDNQTGTITLAAANGGGSAATSATGDASNFRNIYLYGKGYNYVVLNGTADSSGTFGFTVVNYLNGFQLQRLAAPVITGLTNQTVIAGTATVLSPTLAGTPLPGLQWRSNSVAITGQTNASLALNNVQYLQNGTVYSLVASNYVGVATNSMTLTVLVTPGITGLNNQAVATGATVTMSATVSGVPAPATRWQWNGTNLNDGATGSGASLSGSATSTLVINNAQAADTGTYALIASNSAGLVTNYMTLTVSSGNVAPGITGPLDQTVVQTSNATFSVSVSGLPVPTLQWWVNGTVIPGQTNSALTVASVMYAQNGDVYSLVASNDAGMATNRATLYVLVPPGIAQQPTNLTVATGSAATFTVSASGVPSVQYQWSRNGSLIANATNAAYTIASAQGADNAAVFSVMVSNRVGVVASSNVKLTVLSTMTGAFLPTNGAVNLSPDQQLRLVFSSPPILNTNGVLVVRDAANNSVVATIDSSQFLAYVPGNTSIQTIPNAAIRSVEGESYYYMPIALYGNEAWITITNRLAYGHTYYVTCDPGLFLDASGAAFPGITGTNSWSLSTKASGPATPTAATGPTTITIGLDGSGDFATFQGAFDWIPQNNTLPRTIQVKPGIYRDNAALAQNRNFVTMVGDGASRTNAQLIYPFAYFAPPNTVFTAGSLRIESSDVTVLNLTLDNIIYNVYHPTGNAASGAAGAFAGAINTLATTGNRIVFDNVLIKGGQDTIYNISGIVYYYNCEVWGSVDFIYGAALGVFDQCNIVEIRNTGGPCTAPNTAYAQPYGMTFLNCTFPQALVTNGYPYDVGTANTTFMRPWGKDGMTAAINCAIGSQFSTMGYQTFGNTNEDECRAREYGTTLIGGGSAPTMAQRQAAGAYWVDTIDPDYTNNPALIPTDPLLAPPTGTNNRVAVTINPGDYTLSAIFGNSYFNLNGWLPAVPPAITLQPANQIINPGANAGFTAAATGLPVPAYQWLKNGTNYTGATNATLSLTNVQPGDAGSYSVVVSNASGTVTSSNATLSVLGSAPSILTQPANQSMAVGGTAVFTAAASGVPAPAYQWLRNGVPLPNATNATLTLTNVQAADIGGYALIAANSFGAATSANAALILTGGAVPLPVINFNNLLVVTNPPFNALGDGVTDDTAAIQSAINAAALSGLTNGLRGGTVEIPAATNGYLCGPLNFSNNVNLQVDAGAVLRLLPLTNYPGYPTYPMTWHTNGTTVYFVVAANFIQGNNLTNIEISGSGAIDGQGLPWWPWANTNGAVRPRMISLTGCNRTLIQFITLSNSPMFHIAVSSGANTTVQYVTERANSSSDPLNPGHNTDACDITGTNTLVQCNNVSVGDDNFTCGGLSAFILISNNVYGEGHGTSIGSGTFPSVSNYMVINCTYSNTQTGAHIKSDRDRGGFVHNISYINLTMTNALRPIEIYCQYTNTTIPGLDSITPGVAAAYPAAAITADTPVYRDILISNLTANAQSGRAAGLLWGLPENSISNVTLVNVQLTGSKTFGIYDAKNVQIIDSSHNVPAGVSQYSFFDAAVTFSNSTPATSLVTLDGATSNGIANSFQCYNSRLALSNTNAIALNSSVTLGASTFTISNNLTMTPSNSFNFFLGTNAATVIITGNLTLGGTNNIQTGCGFTNGTYTLFTYGGALNGNLPTLGATPAGYVCSWNTNMAGQVNLVATPPPGTPTNLTAAGTNLLINLDWSSSADATGYQVLRSTANAGPYALIASLGATHYADAIILPGTVYYYVVNATNVAGASSDSTPAMAAALPSLVVPFLAVQPAVNALQFAWPPDHTGWHLESQTNSLGGGLGTNWVPVPESYATNQISLPVDPTNGSTFFRLRYQ